MHDVLITMSMMRPANVLIYDASFYVPLQFAN